MVHLIYTNILTSLTLDYTSLIQALQHIPIFPCSMRT